MGGAGFRTSQRASLPGDSLTDKQLDNREVWLTHVVTLLVVTLP
jgi:hypothetical protein